MLKQASLPYHSVRGVKFQCATDGSSAWGTHNHECGNREVSKTISMSSDVRKRYFCIELMVSFRRISSQTGHTNANALSITSSHLQASSKSQCSRDRGSSDRDVSMIMFLRGRSIVKFVPAGGRRDGIVGRVDGFITQSSIMLLGWGSSGRCKHELEILSSESTFLLPPVMVTFTKRRVYVILFFARPLGVFFFS